MKEKLINIFIEKPDNEIMQFLRNDEVDLEERYKQINHYLKLIKNNPNLSFDMNQFIISLFSYKYKDIPILKKK